MDYNFDFTSSSGQQDFKQWVGLQIRDEVNSYTRQVLGSSNTTNANSFVSTSGILPSGIILPYGGGTGVSGTTYITIPDGWLLCNGATVSRTAYSALFNIIGTTYGSGDGSTTFNVPNLLGRTVVGAGVAGSQNGGSGASGVITGGTALPARALGSWFGDVNTQGHTHVINAWATTDGAGNHGHLVRAASGGSIVDGNDGLVRGNAIQDPGFGGPIGGGGAHNHTIPSTTSQNLNGLTQGLSGNNQPSLALTYIIKT